MPKFYFHLRSVDARLPDKRGQDHPNIETARAHANKMAGQILRGSGGNNPYLRDSSFEIVDERGILCAAVPFSNIGASRADAA